MNAVGRVRELLLTVGALVGVVCFASAVAAVGFGVRPLVVQSGSMAPAIPTGALVLAREVPAADLGVGDIVSVPTASGARVMHRVRNIDRPASGAARSLTLQGDANSSADADPYVVERADRVLVDVPRLGYVAAALSGPVGRVAGGVLAAAALVAVLAPALRRSGHASGSSATNHVPGTARRRWRGRPQHEAKHFASGPTRPRRRLGPAPRVAAVLTALAVTAAGVGAARAQPTWAAFTDTGTVTSGQLAAYTVPAPVITSCNVTGSSLFGFTATITWTGVTTPHPISYSGVIVENGVTLAVTSTGGSNRRVQVTSGLLSSLLGSTVTVRIDGFLPGTPAWRSAPTDQRLYIALLGLSMSCVA